MLTNRPKSLLLLIFALHVVVSFSEEDSSKVVLLSFKADSDRFGSLSSWVNSSDPCSGSWLGVTCDSETRRVTKLVLENLWLVGSVGALSQLAELRHLSLSNNSLGSASQLDLSAWPNLKHLYLSENRFAGNFPAGVSRLRRIQRIDLSRNRFSGTIPVAELAQLPRLLTLRLEWNSFDGDLGNLSSSNSPLSDFNVSQNKLSGEIPDWLRRFDATTFQGNENLCGKPLPYDCSNRTDHSPPEESERNDRVSRGSVKLTIVVWSTVVTALVIATLVVTALLLYSWRRKRATWLSGDAKKSGSQRVDSQRMVVFQGCKKGIGCVDELLRASAEMIGKGIVGTTYRVAIDGGDFVVVKRISKFGKEMDWCLRQVLGNLRHTNIVSLRAYHLSLNHHLLLLVYDYYSNGSLSHLLHGNRGPGRTPLDWSTRLRIASDSARGLAFIHDHSKKLKLFHGHLTSSNILVDRYGNACLADVGLPQILRSTLPRSAYVAPELSVSSAPRKFTQACDVYSFGVVVLEMLTGKVMSLRREEWSWEVLDVELLREKEMEEEIVALMEVAMLCLSPMPKDRPMMSVVYRMIEDIRTKGGIRTGMDDLTTLAAFASSNVWN